MSNMELQFQNIFNTWFDTVKNTLGADVAGNLLNQINSIAGDGRTTETVKGIGDAIKGLDEKVGSHLKYNAIFNNTELINNVLSIKNNIVYLEQTI